MKFIMRASKIKKTMWVPPFQIMRLKWEINIYDDDDFPSVPHADSQDHQYKIDLLDGLGTVYTSNRVEYGHLRKKDYQRLICAVEKRNLIKIARHYYREHHPEIPLPMLPQERAEIVNMQLHIRTRYSHLNKFTFTLPVIKSKK